MESASAFTSKHFEQERKEKSTEDRQRHLHHRYLIYPRVCAGLAAALHIAEHPCLFSLYGSTNHGTMSSLCQGLDFIRSHMIGPGCCSGMAVLPLHCTGCRGDGWGMARSRLPAFRGGPAVVGQDRSSGESTESSPAASTTRGCLPGTSGDPDNILRAREHGLRLSPACVVAAGAQQD